MLGKSDAGKTSYVSAMYAAMSNGVGDFAVRAERAADHQRLRRNAQQMQRGSYPDPTNRRSVYQLQLWHEQDRVFDFVWREATRCAADPRGRTRPRPSNCART